jgi:hypothetical protein
MANIDAAFGFKPVRRLDGAAWTGGHTTRKMLNTAGALNRGDVVNQLATGYVAVSAAGKTDHSNLGVFVGCHYLSAAQGFPIWSNYWPGSGAVGDVEVQIIDDPMVVFEVQCSAGPFTLANVGENVDFIVVPSTTGFSKWSANATTGVTATLPFCIVQLGDPAPNVGNGYDHTTPFNVVQVSWNDQFHRQMAGI